MDIRKQSDFHRTKIYSIANIKEPHGLITN